MAKLLPMIQLTLERTTKIRDFNNELITKVVERYTSPSYLPIEYSGPSESTFRLGVSQYSGWH